MMNLFIYLMICYQKEPFAVNVPDLDFKSIKSLRNHRVSNDENDKTYTITLSYKSIII